MPFARQRAIASAALNDAVTTVCVLMVLVMLSISFAGFFYMVVTGGALSWTYSLARLFIPWVGLLSITVAFVRGEHIAMTSLLGILPRPLVVTLRIVNNAILALFAVLMMWYGWSFFAGSTDIYMVSDKIQIPAGWVTASVPVCGAILLVHLVCGADLLTARDPMDEAHRLAVGEAEPGV